MNDSTSRLIKRIILQAKPYWLHVLGIFVLTLLATPIALLKPYALKLLIDSGFGDQTLPGFITLFFPSDYRFDFASVVVIAAVLVIIIALIDNIFNVAEWMLEAYTGEKLVLSFRTRLFNHMQRLSLAYHDRKGTADSLYRLQWDTMGIRSFLISNLAPLISSVITLLSMIFVMFLINWHFALIALCVIPPLFILTRRSTKRLKKDWNKVKNDESMAMSVVHEVMGSLRVVKAFGQEENEGARFSNRANIALKGQLKLAWMGASFYFIVGMIFAVGTAMFIYLGATYVQDGTMTLGNLTLVLAYLSQIFGPLQNISKRLNDIQSSVASIERVFNLFDQENEVSESPGAMQLDRAVGAFEFSGVSFGYGNEEMVLQDISFKIRNGDRVGIMGSTGAGKSTLISLITRFYDTGSGTISIDGVDIKKYKLKDYRKQFSIVLQEPILFSTSIGENIRYGKPDATETEIIDAAKAANAHDFILHCKDGYDTQVGERGMQLSGGERQRISLARAFIKNAPVLILDEPTSSLDMKTEAQIMEAMERLMEGRTSFMITHRIDSLKSCNVIIHIEHGKIIEMVRDYDMEYLLQKKATLLSAAE